MTQHFIVSLITFLIFLSATAITFTIRYYQRLKKLKSDYRYVSKQLEIVSSAYYATSNTKKAPLTTTAA